MSKPTLLRAACSNIYLLRGVHIPMDPKPLPRGLEKFEPVTEQQLAQWRREVKALFGGDD